MAIGDETRQAILLVLMETECQTGLRVGEITETNTPFSASGITSPKDFTKAGIILMRKEGTKTFIILIYVQN